MSGDERSELLKLRETLRYTQRQMAEKLGVPEPRYKNWEYGRSATPSSYIEKAKRLAATEAPGRDLGDPIGASTELEVLVPYIGRVAASSPVNWSDPLDAGLYESVPVHMLLFRGAFCCRIENDCMMDFLRPDDLCIFQSVETAKLNRIVIYRTEPSDTGPVVTVKQWKHDGQRFYLHALNPAYERTYPASGRPIGTLKGIVRKDGRRVVTMFDPDDLLPDST